MHKNKDAHKKPKKVKRYPTHGTLFFITDSKGKVRELHGKKQIRKYFFVSTNWNEIKQHLQKG